MRKLIVATLVLGVTLFMGGLLTVGAQNSQKMEKMGKTETVEGELIDLRCFSAQGKRGEDHQMCATACAESGDPVGVVDAKGKVYTIGSQSAGYADYMAQTARVTGMIAGNVIIPMKVEVKTGTTWKAVSLPKEMM